MSIEHDSLPRLHSSGVQCGALPRQGGSACNVLSIKLDAEAASAENPSLDAGAVLSLHQTGDSLGSGCISTLSYASLKPFGQR